MDKRPKEIDTREEFGNWEMDSVLGKRGKVKKIRCWYRQSGKPETRLYLNCQTIQTRQ